MVGGVVLNLLYGGFNYVTGKFNKDIDDKKRKEEEEIEEIETQQISQDWSICGVQMLVLSNKKYRKQGGLFFLPLEIQTVKTQKFASSIPFDTMDNTTWNISYPPNSDNISILGDSLSRDGNDSTTSLETIYTTLSESSNESWVDVS
jgi:hypothetical protein